MIEQHCQDAIDRLTPREKIVRRAGRDDREMVERWAQEHSLSPLLADVLAETDSVEP